LTGEAAFHGTLMQPTTDSKREQRRRDIVERVERLRTEGLQHKEACVYGDFPSFI
jgi:hypothetical protein